MSELSDANAAASNLESALAQKVGGITSDDVPDNISVELELIPDDYVKKWEQQPDEPATPYKYFSYFRDMGPLRTKVEAAAHFGIVAISMSKYSAKYDWDNRLALFDREEDRLYQLRRQIKMKEIVEGHSAIIEEAIEGLVAPFHALALRIEQDPDFITDLSELNPRRLLDLANKTARTLPSMLAAQRLTLGMPTEITETHHEEKIVHEWDREQLAEIAATLEAAGAFDGQRESDESEEVIDIETFEVLADEPVPETASAPPSS